MKSPKKPQTEISDSPSVSKTYDMPTEVHEWVQTASSRLKYLKGEVDRLKEENKALKLSNRLMEKRVMSAD